MEGWKEEGGEEEGEEGGGGGREGGKGGPCTHTVLFTRLRLMKRKRKDRDEIHEPRSSKQEKGRGIKRRKGEKKLTKGEWGK